jgi:hypothetical protein
MGKVMDWLFTGYITEDLHNAKMSALAADFKIKCDYLGDLLAAKTLELETLKNKIVERAQTPTTIKAKSAAEIRSLMEREAEREFEEANG